MRGLERKRCWAYSVSNFICPDFLWGLAMGRKYPLSRRPSANSFRNAVVRESEMALRLAEGRVQDWVFDDDGRHGAILD